ncbi:hypothetical protein [Blastochloris tepida]|uniref:HTH merR-type domain-containing protein n=1 Tax=Blastochloris tepida TaxID=2233851 RepID=A0A348FXS6_9HYPH|nr:hypothetical protein [Blastochloris tepida]BBF92109.1 hypothetical protein BLTE_07940 [Blastochloris tepida]
MRAQFAYTLKKFGPTRAEEISGVARVTQRDWRREGHLPSSEGMARYDLFDLCELWVLKTCADVGLGPKRAKAFSRGAGLHLAWHCLRLIAAYEGDHEKAPFSKHEKTFDLGGQSQPTPSWGRRSRWLADHILFGKDDPEEASKFFIIWPDGEAGPGDTILDFNLAGSFQSKRGAMIVLPLELAARWIVDAAGEPFVQITFGDPK